MHTAPLKILAVDDEQLLLWALERACRGRTLDISTAATNEQAFTKIAHCHFDLFLLDFDLKDQSSQLLLQEIDERCPYIPVIIMTTSDTKSSRLNNAIRAVRKQGAWHLLEKPFRLDQLICFIEQIFQEAGSEKLCLNDQTHNFDNEKRHSLRRSHVLPVAFTFKRISDGQQRELSANGIITDISDYGLGLLSRVPLEIDQMLGFGKQFNAPFGVVAWSCMIESQTCRAGIRLC